MSNSSIPNQLVAIACTEGAEKAYGDIQQFALNLTEEGKDRLIALICDCYPPDHPKAKMSNFPPPTQT